MPPAGGRRCSTTRHRRAVAAGALAPQNSALIQQLFRGAERGRAFGFFGATVGISTAAGPVLGGLILALAGGFQGWLIEKTHRVERAMLIVGGLLLVYPGTLADATGALLTGAVIAWQLVRRRGAQAATLG